MLDIYLDMARRYIPIYTCLCVAYWRAAFMIAHRIGIANFSNRSFVVLSLIYLPLRPVHETAPCCPQTACFARSSWLTKKNHVDA